MRKRPHRLVPPPGFSLVELLVVIGVIALLVGLLMPAISGARQQSLTVKCASNLRQIGIALETYNQAYQRLPDAASPLSATLVEVKMGTAEMFVCPASGADRGEDYRMNETFAGLPKSAGNASDVLAREVWQSA